MSYDRSVRIRLAVLGVIAAALVAMLVLFQQKRSPSGDAIVDASDEAQPAPDAPASGASAPTPPPTAEAAAPPPGTVVLHEGTVAEPGSRFSLEGLDVDRRRAWVRRETADGKVFEILSVDYEKSPPAIDAWRATEATAGSWTSKAWDFQPINGTLESDLVRYAEVARATPRRRRAPTFAASADRIAYATRSTEKEGATWLMVAPRDAKGPRRVDNGMVTSDGPVFSPDGKHLAFRACAKDPCGFEIYIATGAAAPVRAAIPPDAMAPFVSADSKWVYAFARGPKDAGGCLWRAELDRPAVSAKVHCNADSLSAGHAVLDDRAESALVCGNMRADNIGCAWATLPDGAFEGGWSGASQPAVLSRSGLTLSLDGEGIRVSDLRSGESKTVPDGRAEIETARFVSDSEIVALQSQGSTYRLVRIDLRRWLAP